MRDLARCLLGEGDDDELAELHAGRAMSAATRPTRLVVLPLPAPADTAMRLAWVGLDPRWQLDRLGPRSSGSAASLPRVDLEQPSALGEILDAERVDTAHQAVVR